jgi:hypothetical protein
MVCGVKMRQGSGVSGEKQAKCNHSRTTRGERAMGRANSAAENAGTGPR